MAMKKLFVSLPGEKNFKIYQQGSEGDELFHFVSFDNQRRISMPISPTTDDSIDSAERIYKSGNTAMDLKAYHGFLINSINEIKTKGLGKIVISRTKEYTRSMDILSLYKKLVDLYPSACVYLFIHPDCGVWMGATPELLLRGDGNEVKTMSLAGTRRLGEEGAFTAKEEEEQQLVTDYIHQLFVEETTLSNVSKKEPELHQAGNLVHFKTEITASTSRDFDSDNFVQRLHPTPAVGGSPKKEALEFINQHEGYDREFYTGYFGFTNAKDFRYFVNLRCMQIFKASMVLYAGGGITKDSDAEAEWEETEVKMQTLLAAFQPY